MKASRSSSGLVAKHGDTPVQRGAVDADIDPDADWPLPVWHRRAKCDPVGSWSALLAQKKATSKREAILRKVVSDATNGERPDLLGAEHALERGVARMSHMSASLGCYRFPSAEPPTPPTAATDATTPGS